MALYVKFAQKKKPRTVREFLKKYYSNILGDYYAKGHDTFATPECNYMHCDKKYRSFDDLLELVTTYYPSIKPVKLMHYLLTTEFKGKGNFVYRPNLGTCSTMDRIRFIPHSIAGYDNIYSKMGKSRYIWRELLMPLGLTNKVQFLEYTKNPK